MIAVKNKNTIFPEKIFTRSGKLGGMIKDRIKSTLDNELNIKKFVKDDPKKIDLFAIGIFQRIFVEILNFNLVRGTFFGVAESISVTEWNRQARGEEAYIIAEKEDFRILYVRLKKLTRPAQRFSVSSIIREGWARKGEFIAIFYEEGSDVWHLVSPHITEGRNILRRYVVGMGEKHRTVSENLAKMDATIREPLFERVQEAFKLKPVTEKFYEDYKKYFGKIKEHLIYLGIKIRDSKRYSHLFLNRLMFIYFIQKKGWIGDNKEFVKGYLESYREFGENNRLHEKWLNTLFFNAMNKPPREKNFSTGFSSEICEVLNEIPYLNGGLFEKDNVDELGIELPDSLVIEVIDNFLENYNFTITEESPFDVDIAVDPAILGKIYESLIAEEERGKAGIFYTPRIEVDFMCRLALYEYFLQQGTEKSMTLNDILVDRLLEKIIEFLFTPPEEWKKEDTIEFHVLRKFLDKLKIVDPACGSGAFLVGMLNVLQELYRKMGIEIDYTLKENIINNNLYGVDIKDWAVRMAELRLWLALVESEDEVPDIEPVLPNFSFKLRVGDSIVQKIGGDFIKLEKIKGELGKESSEDLNKLELLKERFFRGEKGLLKEIEKTQENILDRYITRKISILQENKRKQTTLEGEITAKSQSELREIENKIDSLKKSKENLRKARREKLFVWDLDFPEVMLYGGFDIVIANPPYIRQEKIIKQDLDPEELVSLTNRELVKLKEEYKEDLINYVLKTYNINIGKRCDLYVHFFFKGLELLNPKGNMVYISSNSWLDVNYGKYLQEGLLRYSYLKYIIDNNAKRTFEESEINTIISVIKKKSENNIVKGETDFIVLNKPFEDINKPSNMEKVLLKKYVSFNETYLKNEALNISIMNDFRILNISQKSLWKLGGGDISLKTKLNSIIDNGYIFASGNYSGGKWGKYLRAPDIYFKILEKGKQNLVPFKEVVEIKFGIKTGANGFFFVKQITNNISDKLKQVMNLHYIKSEKEVNSNKLVLIAPTEYKYNDNCKLFLVEENSLLGAVKNTSEHEELNILTPKVFLFSPTEKNLGSFAQEYIKWGEKQGFHLRKSCRTRKPWWQIISPRTKQPSNIGFNYNIYDTGHFYYSKDLLCFSDNFHMVYSNDPTIVAIGESTLIVLFINIDCRVSFGGGKAKLQAYELSDLPFININNISQDLREKLSSLILNKRSMKIKSIFEELGTSNPEDVSFKKISKERLAIDKLIMENILGLSEEEQLGVYRAVVELIRTRFEKARSL